MYYFVWPRSKRYHSREPLTYESDKNLKPGTIVKIQLQTELVTGVIANSTHKPRFSTKPIKQILPLPHLPNHLLRLAVWLTNYYPAPLGLICQQLVPANLSDQPPTPPEPVLASAETAKLPPLNEGQIAALAQMEPRDTYLLHGVTGSGKTRVYLELAIKTIISGKSVIILTPEIGLTSQLEATLKEVFGNRVVLYHSKQTPSARLQSWLRCLSAKEPLVVVGPRSALFSPVAKPGLIVLDEAHEPSYKQQQAPHYQTAKVAAYLAQLTRASLVLGSATPSVNDYFLAEQKQKPIIRLTKLAKPGEFTRPTVTVVDRKDNSLFNRSPLLSQTLIKAIERALDAGEQSLLYLNRRGTARLVMCENCGWQAICPRDNLPLTYHGDLHRLRCHACDYQTSVPTNCPVCSFPSVIFKTAGTKAVVAEVERLFPKVKVARFDTDNLKAERFESHYENIKAGDVDILVGTQLLAKGLDLPKLSTLGIVLADTSLYLPDFTAQERTFQLINQVLGRIGRGHLPGQAFIQTYHPEHPLLAQAIAGDYDNFYKSELTQRKQFLFPPYCFLLKLIVRRASAKSAESAASRLKADLETAKRSILVEGPAPAFHERIQNKHQWQLVVKSKQRSELVAIINQLPANWSYDLDPIDLL